MDILNSGSFVTLDNREKIDQLIYTARELANEVSRTDGFESTGQTNHQLGLEMWKGAEYVCRAHEEANIRNLFLSKFLEKLREIEKEVLVRTPAVAAIATGQQSVSEPTSPPEFQSPKSEPPQIPTEEVSVEDEYLGMVPTDDQANDDRSSYANECVPEFEAEIAEMNASGADDPTIPLAESSDDKEQGAPVEFENLISSAETAGVVTATKEPKSDAPVTLEQAADELVEYVVPGPLGSTPIESIVLAEKEPYNLDACTITAVVQILPESAGRRKCVVSIRTHDFAPLVSVSEADVNDILPHVSGSLGDILEQYRSDLPAKAADKLKKQKPVAKKQSKSGSKSVKETTAHAESTEMSQPATGASIPKDEINPGQQGLFTS